MTDQQTTDLSPSGIQRLLEICEATDGLGAELVKRVDPISLEAGLFIATARTALPDALRRIAALEEALQALIDRSNNREMGTGKVPDMREIAIKALADVGIPMSASRDRIVAAAILTEAGAIMSVERPGRHHTILHALPNAPWKHKAEQGFLTDSGTFVGRMQALKIARLSGQTLRETAPQHGLFSEDVW